MLVDLEQIVVSDRIRKDFGNIDELAKDIQQNGLINPPVVTPELQLIAGERRLKACKTLGHEQIEVRIITVKDYEHQLRLEISENENRKEFTFSERVEWARRLEQVETLKARERMADPVQNFAEGETGRSRDKVAVESGFGSGETYRKAKFIADHAEPEAIRRLDHGESSIHKEYEQLKARLNQTESELRQVKDTMEQQIQQRTAEKIQQLQEQIQQIQMQQREANEKEAMRFQEQIDALQVELGDAQKELLERPRVEVVSEELKRSLDELRHQNATLQTELDTKSKVEERLRKEKSVALEAKRQAEEKALEERRERERLAQSLTSAGQSDEHFQMLQNFERRLLDVKKEAVGMLEVWNPELISEEIYSGFTILLGGVIDTLEELRRKKRAGNNIYLFRKER